MPVNDLAVMNKLTPPFNLSVGQKLRVPQSVNVIASEKTKQVTPETKTQQTKATV